MDVLCTTLTKYVNYFRNTIFEFVEIVLIKAVFLQKNVVQKNYKLKVLVLIIVKNLTGSSLGK